MNAVADKYADQGVGSIFVYAREAHPGENISYHRTMADKIHNAQAFRAEYNVTRQIYLDDLTGDGHIAYGGGSNMTYIFNRAGTPLYRSMWTDALSAENAVIYYLDVLERRRNREKLAPFKVERIDYRDVDKERRIEGLAKAGPSALAEWQTLYDKNILTFKPATDPGDKNTPSPI